MATVHLRAVVDMLQCSVRDRAVGMVLNGGRLWASEIYGGGFNAFLAYQWVSSQWVMIRGTSHLSWLASTQ